MDKKNEFPVVDVMALYRKLAEQPNRSDYTLDEILMQQTPRFTIVVAYDQGRVIGMDNKLPWNIPEDMAHFARYTGTKNIVMGRKTFESIGRPLPNRRNVVVSRNPDLIIEGVEVVGSLQAALEILGSDKENCLIGGGSLYKEALDAGLVDEIMATEIPDTHVGDTYFPEIDPKEWITMHRYPSVSGSCWFTKYYTKRIGRPRVRNFIDGRFLPCIPVNVGEVMENIPPPNDPLRYLRSSLKELQEKLGGKSHLIDGSSLRKLPVIDPAMVDLWCSSLKDEVGSVPDYRFIISPHSVDLEKHSKEIDLELYTHLARKEGYDLKGFNILKTSKRRQRNPAARYEVASFGELFNTSDLNPWNSPTGSRTQMFHTYQVPLQWRIKQMSAQEFLDFVTHPVTLIERHRSHSMHFKSIATNHRIRKLAMRPEYNHHEHHVKLQEKYYFAMRPNKQEK